jgi:SAM-dependent methyltransferase
VNRDQLEDRIAAFPQWSYRFEFDNGASTFVPDGRLVNRHEQRRRYFFEALLRLHGGSLKGQRILDLGCGAGFWALQAIEAGADFVLGLDSRDMYVEQAELVFEAKGVDRARYHFELADVFEREPPGKFDVVLCLALVNHTSRPVELFELMAATDAEILLVETELVRSSSSVFALSSAADGSKTRAHRSVLVPSRGAVEELAGDVGYQSVALERNMTDYTGLNDYRTGRRLAFFCSKGRPLDALPVEERALLPWWLAPVDPSKALRRLRA